MNLLYFKETESKNEVIEVIQNNAKVMWLNLFYPTDIRALLCLRFI